MQTAQDKRVAYWKAQIRRISVLLVIWFLTSMVFSIYLAEALNAYTFLGVPFGFWMAQQGSIYIFILIILVYALLTDRADREFGFEETADTTSGAAEAH